MNTANMNPTYPSVSLTEFATAYRPVDIPAAGRGYSRSYQRDHSFFCSIDDASHTSANLDETRFPHKSFRISFRAPSPIDRGWQAQINGARYEITQVHKTSPRAALVMATATEISI